jgi:hypothetical protein
MGVFAPNGSYPEGPGYWVYGTSYNVLLIDMLEKVLRTDFGLSKAPGFDQTGQYLSLATGPSGRFFNYADGGDGRGVVPVLFWFGDRYNRPDWLLGEHDRIQEMIIKASGKSSRAYKLRLLPLALLWMNGPAPEPVDIGMPLHWLAKNEVPISIHRSAWTDPRAVYVGFKGGSPGANHGHMDVGSFVLDSDGVRWAIELGSESYYRIESRSMNLWDRDQKGDRWSIFRLNNFSHNTLVIDGQHQRAEGHGTFVGFSDDPAHPYSVLDMSTAYTGQAESVLRGTALHNDRVILVQDELKGLKPGSRVRWGMVTSATPENQSPTGMELTQDGEKLGLRLLGPETAEWRIVNTEKPAREWDSPNPDTRMIAFEAVAPANGHLQWAVQCIPGGLKDLKSPPPRLIPLAEWK